jgi:hypothetical protein
VMDLMIAKTNLMRLDVVSIFLIFVAILMTCSYTEKECMWLLKLEWKTLLIQIT